MRRTLTICALMCISPALILPAAAEIKWHQPPDMHLGADHESWTIAGGPRYQVADDFLCRDGSPVTEVHWWGSYIPGPDGHVERFIIQFWSNAPAGPNNPYSRPDELLYDVTVEDVPEAFFGETSGGETVFEYHTSLPEPFLQDRGRVYWISIIAVLRDIDQAWGWHQSRVQYNDASVWREGEGDWHPIHDQWERRVDMAFFLTTEDPEGSGNGVKWVQCPDMETGVGAWSQFGPLWAETADDFLCEDGQPVVAIRWWGSYPGPHGSDMRVPRFVVEFYEDVPAGVDELFSHPGERLYEELVEFTEVYVFTTPDGEDVFEYVGVLPVPFEPTAGDIYWMSVIALLDLPGIWGWHASNEHYNDMAVNRAGPEWYPIAFPSGEPVDMSFELIGAEGGVTWRLEPITEHAADLQSQISFDVLWDSAVADDFLCEDGAPISDVQWWGSYWANMRAPLQGFWLRFHEDVPWDPGLGHSRPGELLAEYFVQEYNETFYGEDGTGEIVYQYHAKLPESFHQEAGRVYWLSIVADGVTPPQWGWRDSRFRWNDCAVVRDSVFGIDDWAELSNPNLDVATDMAFVLTTPVLTRAPEGFFSPLWVWFSFPLSPLGSNEMSDVLGFDATNAVTRWNPIEKNLELYPDDFHTIDVGRGYTLFTFEDRAPEYVGTVPPKVAYLPRAGWTWIGLPDPEDYHQGWLLVENLVTGEIRTAPADAASDVPFVNWNFIYWNSYVDTAQICIFDGSCDDMWMHPWYGYRVWSFTGHLRLVFNRPCP